MPAGEGFEEGVEEEESRILVVDGLQTFTIDNYRQNRK